MSSRIRWGILGPGSIANVFVEALKFVPSAEITAVGSRDLERARLFAAKHDIPRAYGSYAQLLEDKQVDIVYIATPHNMHHRNTIDALNASKHVLCEKPFAVNAVEAAEMIEVAKSCNRFCMEAMWTRFLPVMREVSKAVSQNVIGDVKLLTADFGFKADPVIKPRIVAPELAGGALLDVGVYPIAFANMVLGKPKSVQCSSLFDSSGIDELDVITLKYDECALAQLSCSCVAAGTTEAVIVGSDGWIRIYQPWYKGNKYTVKTVTEPERTIELESHKNGFVYQIRHIHECLEKGATESDIMPFADTLTVAQIMDTARNRTGLVYPFEPGIPMSYFD